MKNLEMSEAHQSQRGYFAASLYNEMIKNPRISVVTGDLGYGMLDRIKQDFPDRLINVGAAEQTALGVAVGLALKGEIPFVYTITSFYLRAAETIGLYLHGEQIPVKLVGGGRDADYAHDGPSHHAGLAQAFLGSLNIENYYPDEKEQVPGLVEDMVTNGVPSFISLRR